MSVGEINKGAVALIMVLVLGASGFLWYSHMYKPAVAERATAAAAAETAEAGLAAAKQRLAAAQQQADDAKKDSAKPDDSVARLAKARTAIPDRKLIDDAAIVLVELAGRSGVQTYFKTGGDNADAATPAEGGSLQGATPLDLEFEAAGTYAEMMQFMSLVEGTVEERDDKLYTRGRLFNVVSLEIGSEEEEDSAGGFGGGTEVQSDELQLGPNDIKFKVIVRMYTSSTDNAENVGLATEDPAAAGTDPAAAGQAGAPQDGGATGTDPAAGAGAMGTAATTDPALAGGDPAAAGAGAAAGGAAL